MEHSDTQPKQRARFIIAIASVLDQISALRRNESNSKYAAFLVNDRGSPEEYDYVDKGGLQIDICKLGATFPWLQVRCYPQFQEYVHFHV